MSTHDDGSRAGRPALSRRDLLRLAAAGAGAALLAACSRKPATSGAAAGTLADVLGKGTQLSLLNGQSALPVGRSLFTFGLSSPDGNLITQGAPQVWFAKDDRSKAIGPWRASWYALTAYAEEHDHSPTAGLPGFYGAVVDIPSAGNWMVGAAAQITSGRGIGSGGVPVSETVLHAVGSKAKSVPTPVATTPAARKLVCTRQPPCPMHAISLDRALASGKPTVVSFATPLLCESRMCGPVVDEQLAAFHELGAAKANFIHVEEHPGAHPDPNKVAPAFAAWGFQSEPWVFVIDKAGVIRARFEGPVNAGQIVAAVQPLL